MVSVLTQQEHCSADGQAPDAWLMAGKGSCRGKSLSCVHSSYGPKWRQWQARQAWMSLSSTVPTQAQAPPQLPALLCVMGDRGGQQAGAQRAGG